MAAGPPTRAAARRRRDPSPGTHVAHFIDEEGRPTAYLTDAEQRPAAEAALAGFLASFGWTGADLQVRQADYDYLQLDGWYRSAWPQALAVTGSVYSHIDESANRMSFGGLDMAAVSQMLNTITAAGVPTDAFSVELTGPVAELATLRDRIRPAIGGLQIHFFPTPASPVVLACTIGFNAISAGAHSFLTNSHCSNVQGDDALVSTEYYQPTRSLVVNPDDLIALEVDDPQYFIGGECPVGRRCRYSDASRAEYLPDQPFVLGQIARTVTPNDARIDGNVNPAPLVIDDANPIWSIEAEQAHPVLGQHLNKVGRRTGWTRGPVSATCVNVNITLSEVTQLCQSFVATFVGGGDSGSPVFGEHTDGSAFLAGLLWGSRSDLVTGEVIEFIFSPFQAVVDEMGEMTTFEPDGGRKKPKKEKKVK